MKFRYGVYDSNNTLVWQSALVEVLDDQPFMRYDPIPPMPDGGWVLLAKVPETDILPIGDPKERRAV